MLRTSRDARKEKASPPSALPSLLLDPTSARTPPSRRRDLLQHGAHEALVRPREPHVLVPQIPTAAPLRRERRSERSETLSLELLDQKTKRDSWEVSASVNRGKER